MKTNHFLLIPSSLLLAVVVLVSLLDDVNAFYLPDFPRDDSKCTDFSTRFKESNKKHQDTYPLSTLNGKPGAILQFSLVDHNLVGRIIYNGIFGYLSFGYIGPNPNNPMLGGAVIMAMRGGGYTVEKGMNLSSPPLITEVFINDSVRDFSTWSEPYVYKRNYVGDFKVSTTADNCYTILEFDAHYIAGRHFNESGTDKFMWAANDIDSFMKPHGDKAGQFSIDWKKYEVKPTVSPLLRPTVPPKPTVPPVFPPFSFRPPVPASTPVKVPVASPVPAPSSSGGFFARMMKGFMAFMRGLWPF